jgi:hypothetical protein
LEAVEGAFGSNIDRAVLVKAYRPAGRQRRYGPAECIGAVKHRFEGNPDHRVSTSYGMTRLTNAFSKKAANREPRSHDGDLFSCSTISCASIKPCGTERSA